MTQPPAIPAHYAALMASDRVSRTTRTALLSRAAEPTDTTALATALSTAQLHTLRALTHFILPQTGGIIDIAGRIDAMLAEGAGDGWRFADLPPDLAAYRDGLDALDAWARADGGECFAALPAAAQQSMLLDLAAARSPRCIAPTCIAPACTLMGPHQLARWFADVRSDATRLYVSHPATLARIGYSGPFYGGDTERLPGFPAPEARESWEPEPQAGRGGRA